MVVKDAVISDPLADGQVKVSRRSGERFISYSERPHSLAKPLERNFTAERYIISSREIFETVNNASKSGM